MYGKAIGEGMQALVAAGVVRSVIGAAVGYLGGRIVSYILNEQEALEKKIVKLKKLNLLLKILESPILKVFKSLADKKKNINIIDKQDRKADMVVSENLGRQQKKMIVIKPQIITAVLTVLGGCAGMAAKSVLMDRYAIGLTVLGGCAGAVAGSVLVNHCDIQ